MTAMSDVLAAEIAYRTYMRMKEEALPAPRPIPRRLVPRAFYMMTEASGVVYGQMLYTTLTRHRTGWVLCRYSGDIARPPETRTVDGAEHYTLDVKLTGKAHVSASLYREAVISCLSMHRRLEPTTVVLHVYKFVREKLHA